MHQEIVNVKILDCVRRRASQSFEAASAANEIGVGILGPIFHGMRGHKPRGKHGFPAAVVPGQIAQEKNIPREQGCFLKCLPPQLLSKARAEHAIVFKDKRAVKIPLDCQLPQGPMRLKAPYSSDRAGLRLQDFNGEIQRFQDSLLKKLPALRPGAKIDDKDPNLSQLLEVLHAFLLSLTRDCSFADMGSAGQEEEKAGVVQNQCLQPPSLS
jgi:hypothetical protein